MKARRWLLAWVLAIVAVLTVSDEGSDTQIPCPWVCTQIEYGSFWWYVQCWPLPKVCSSDPSTGAGGGSSGVGGAL